MYNINYGGISMVPNPTLQYGEYETPEITGKVYITMESITTGKPHLYVKQHKTDDRWLEITPDTDFSTCWAFSKQGAKKIIERFKSKTYKVNYDKGLLKFGTIDEYSH